MSHLVVSVPKKRELKGESKGGLDPKKREKKKKREGGIFLISRDKYVGRGFSLLSSPNPDPISHTEKEKEKRRRRRRRRRRRLKFLISKSIKGEKFVFSST